MSRVERKGLLTAFGPFIELPGGKMRGNTSTAVLEHIRNSDPLHRRLKEAMGVDSFDFAVIDAMRMEIGESVKAALEGELDQYHAVVSLGEGGPTLENVNQSAPFGPIVKNYDRVCVELKAGNKILGGRFGQMGEHKLDDGYDINHRMTHRDADKLATLFKYDEGIRVNDSDYGAGTDLCNALLRLLLEWMGNDVDRKGFFVHVPAVTDDDESLMTILSLPRLANLFRQWAGLDAKSGNPLLEDEEIRIIKPKVIRRSVEWMAENVVKAAERYFVDRPV